MDKPPSHEEIRRRWAETYGETSLPPTERRSNRRPLYVTVLVLIALVAGWLVLRGQLGGAPPTTPPAQAGTDQIVQFDPTKPYANTPAAGWADGAEGIALPAPVAVGAFSAQQVGTAEAKAKQALVAAHLDNQILVGHDPSAFLALLAPSVRAQVRTEIGNGRDNDYGGALSLLLTGYHLLPAPIKVNGTMTPGVAGDGNLVIHTNYVFAFPFASADPSAIQHAWQTVAVQHAQVDFETVAGSHYAVADQGLWLMNVSSYYADVDCANNIQDYLGPEYADPPAPGGPTDTNDPNSYFDPSHTMTIMDSCKS